MFLMFEVVKYLFTVIMFGFTAPALLGCCLSSLKEIEPCACLPAERIGISLSSVSIAVPHMHSHSSHSLVCQINERLELSDD